MQDSTAQWLYITILAEPNAARDGARLWRQPELARRASALGGRVHALGAVGAALSKLDKSKGLVCATKTERSCTLWSLTEAVRARACAAAPAPPGSALMTAEP
jgi:hypothetical protein